VKYQAPVAVALIAAIVHEIFNQHFVVWIGYGNCSSKCIDPGCGSCSGTNGGSVVNHLNDLARNVDITA
jgi:hypothetical protein